MGDPKFGTDATVPAPLGDPSIPPTSTPVEGHPRIAGRYEILGLLGAGGMGSVYRARDVTLDEMVALKVLRKELAASPGMLERFRQEVKLARKVTHKNVARTFDIGTDGNEFFLTMELVDGEPLSSIAARRGRLPLAEVVTIVEGVCSGLSAAHAAGVIHRDLKPENVVIAKDGRVAITDFGIARALDAEGAGRTLGSSAGTPAYMAPEQVEGKRDLDARCDVYALGTMMYELLTGQAAWPGESVVAIAAARLIRPPPDPRAVVRDVPDRAAELVMKCMARERDARFASVDELMRALAGLTLPAVPVVGPSFAPPALAVVPREPSGKTVAVLPVANLGDAGDAYLADALFDDLVDLLSMVEGLRVRPRGATVRYADRDRDPREVGRALGVKVVVDGSLRRVGETIRIHARLVTVDDGFQLWAKRFDTTTAGVLSVGDAAARAIAEALTAHVEQAPRVAPTDPEALDLYMRGRYAYHRAWLDANAEAVQLLEQAYARAPKDPRIVAGYALALVRKYAVSEAAGVDDEARARAEEALAMDPANAEARVGLAALHIYRGEAVAGAAELRRALQRSPDAPDALDWKGRLLVEVGRPHEGIAALQRAHDLLPQLGHTKATIARTRALMGDWAACDELLREMPTNVFDARMSWIMRGRLTMWRLDAKLGEALVRDFEVGGQMVPEPYRTNILSMAHITEHKQLTEAISRQLAQTLPETRRVPRRGMYFAQLKAEIMCAVGAPEEAKRMLHDADANGLSDAMWFQHCPLLDLVRDDPEVKAIGQRVADRADRIREALGVP